MGLIVTDSQHYSDIADAIREMNGTNDTFMPSQMASAIENRPIINWMGEDPEFIKNVYSLSTTLDQTSFNGWGPSTTAYTIKASETISTTETMDLTNYDYVLVWLSDCNVSYNSTWSASKATCLRELCLYTQAIFRRPASVSSVESKLYDYNAVQQDIYAEYWCKYYSTASAISLGYTTYSPCYISAVTAATFSSTSATSPTVTIKTPVLSARCSSTYFSVGNAGKVDQANTTVKMVGKLYRVKAGTCGSRQGWGVLVDAWNNPI